jgi:large subunit ribosomal protein L15
MQLHELKSHSSNKAKSRVGRGGKRGKTSGRGMKGQKARAGRKLRPEMRDIIKKIPKLRGYRFSPVSEKPTTVNLGDLESVFENGENVNPVTLVEKKLVSKKGGKLPNVKILGNGNLTKKIAVSKCTVSASALEAIKKAGGSVEEK